jgi:signal transduction histidine kinase
MELFFKEKRDGGAITARMQKELKDLQSRNRGLQMEAANEKFSTALLRHSVISENFEVFLQKVHQDLYKARSDCERIIWITVDEKGSVSIGQDSHRAPKDDVPQAVTDALLTLCHGAVPRLQEGGKFLLAQGKDLDEYRSVADWMYGALLLIPVRINNELCGMVLMAFDGEIILDETIDVRSGILADTMSLTLVQDHQRKALERERDRAVTAERTKSNFFAQVSHDIRTPLNAVIGYADLLSSGKYETGKEHEYYENIVLCGNALLNLINNVLDLNKLGAGEMEVSQESVDFAKMAQEAMRIFSLDAKAKNLCMSCEVADMPQLDLDKKHILRILVNFLSNGVKYTNKGGVTLRANFREDTSNTGTLRFEVEDTGIGIAEDRQSEMLKPYEQTGALQIRMEGTGLGLAISHSLIELMGGKMSLKSQLGKGSTFCVELPGVHYRKLVASGEGQPVAKACDCGEMSLLLVDDLDMNLRVLAAVCKKYGFKDIVTAHDGLEALEKMKQQYFHLVLSDIWMPNMDGFGLIEKIRQDESLKDIPVFAITADVSSMQDNRANLFTSIVLKPISMAKLQEIMEKVFG